MASDSAQAGSGRDDYPAGMPRRFQPVPKPQGRQSMSEHESKVLPVAAEAVSKPLGFGTSELQTIQTDENRAASSHPMPAHLAGDILTAAQGIRDRHKELFAADRKLKDRAARLFRTVLPPRPRCPGRKRIPSVTIAMRMHKKLTNENATARPEEIWAKIYPKAIPNYASLTQGDRWMEQRRLRDRVHSRRLWRRKREHREKRRGEQPECNLCG